jgi:hypothetical protein
VWIPDASGAWVLAFTYVDRTAGPSAKGAVVPDPPSPDDIRRAVDRPDRTFRDPVQFKAVPIGVEEALRLGLPRDPPWIGYFEGKPVPPPRGEPSREVTAVVTRAGVLVAGARVRLGWWDEPTWSVAPLDTRITGADGRAAFPLAPTRGELGAIADMTGEGSAAVEIPEDGVVTLSLLRLSVLEGVTTRRGAPAVGYLSLYPLRGGLHQVKRGTASGRYRIEAVVPGRYRVEVCGVDPRTHMSAGTPIHDEVEIHEGQTVRRDYALIAGVPIRIALGVQSSQHQATVMLFQGEVAPRDSTEVTALWRSLPEGAYQSPNTYSNDGEKLTTQLADIPPGRYTLTVSRYSSSGRGPAQPVVCVPITVEDDPIDVSMDLLPLRKA